VPGDGSGLNFCSIAEYVRYYYKDRTHLDSGRQRRAVGGRLCAWDLSVWLDAD